MKNTRGFTLLELMVAVALIAIVATIAVPEWREFVANRRAAGASRDVYNALQHTRMMAIKEGRTATVHFVEDATTSEDDDFRVLRVGFDTGTVAVDDDAFEIDDNELELEVKLPDGIVGKANRNPMQYNSRGIIVMGNGTITVWSTLTNRAYEVVVNNLGTLRQASGANSGGS